MVNKNKPQIEQTIVTGKNKKIISYHANKLVKPFGNGTAHVILPVGLIGKDIQVSFNCNMENPK